ncbi:MAG: hypothetical protein DWQ49_05865 [Bacteroidetes bacterium]|nr:MAG: hypothetical protein DWQ49_05865 [Bacteroidota bacterium]
MPLNDYNLYMARKKSKKLLEDYMQTHGMDENAPRGPSSLEQVWGNDGTTRYNTLDADVYAARLADMTRVDLQREAQKRGIVPIEDGKKLRDRLIKEFKLYVGSLTMPPISKKEKKEIPADVLKTLREGQ